MMRSAVHPVNSTFLDRCSFLDSIMNNFNRVEATSSSATGNIPSAPPAPRPQTPDCLKAPFKALEKVNAAHEDVSNFLKAQEPQRKSGLSAIQWLDGAGGKRK